MKRIFGIFFFVVGVSFQGLSQHQDPSWSVRRAIINEQCVESDSLCHVLHTLGTFEGHLRSFFMATTNHDEYPDYYALAMGGGLGYYSPIIKNFQAGMSGFIIYNMASSHLGPETPFSNRYELSLFDVQDPENHDDLDRLEDLYLRYYISQETHSYVQFGKFHLKTPLINLQDGRMRPNLQEGVFGEFNEWKKLKLKAGWLWKTSPRGTIHWYDMGESIGVYPMGRAINGARADYAGHVETPGIAILSAGFNPMKEVNVQLWNYHAPDLFNMFMPKVEWKKKSHSILWSAGLQYFWQSSLYKDTLSVEQQYITKGEQSHSLSGKVGRTNTVSGADWSLNYTRITSHGRFLLPREWGVESFYTFIQRERLEGAGDVHAVMAQNLFYLDKAHHFSFQTMAGMTWMPAVTKAELNKYNLPSYYQVNLRARYAFSGFWKGLRADVLYLYKGNMSPNLEVTPSTYHNKIDMHHASLVLDYYF